MHLGWIEALPLEFAIHVRDCFRGVGDAVFHGGPVCMHGIEFANASSVRTEAECTSHRSRRVVIDCQGVVRCAAAGALRVLR